MVVLKIYDKSTGKQAQATLTYERREQSYYMRIQHPSEAYPVMLPGDTITIMYRQGRSLFEVDYTFPESRLKIDGAVKEEGTKFDRIITYKSIEIPDLTLQRLYDDIKKEGKGYLVEGEVTVEKMKFYSNYVTRLRNVPSYVNVIIDSRNPSFVP